MGAFSYAADLLDPPANPYLHDPVRWARECIRWRHDEQPTSYQQGSWQALVDHGRVAIRGPHGLGKTAGAAILVHWFALTRDQQAIDWKIVTTASAWRQLTHYLWPEIHKWAKRIDWDAVGRRPYSAHELLHQNLKLTHGEAFAAASNDHEKIEGAHADSILYVYDEAKAIPTATFDATEGAFSGAGTDTAVEAFALAQSTPGAPAGRFYDIHSRKAGYEDWHPIHVTRDQVIAEGRMSKEWADQRAAQWGEDSSLYLNRVRGDFAADDADAVIPLPWVEAANERWHAATRTGPQTCLGVDVARSGADDTVIAERHGWHIRRLRHYSRQRTTATTKAVIELLAGGYAIVDVIGIGAGVVDQLATQGYPVRAFNASARTDMTDEAGELGFVNVRSAAWWNLRLLLDPELGPGVALPPDDLLTGDLCAPRWTVRAGGKIYVESKEDIRKRIGRSTDDADAVIQAFWSGQPAEDDRIVEWSDPVSIGPDL